MGCHAQHTVMPFVIEPAVETIAAGPWYPPQNLCCRPTFKTTYTEEVAGTHPLCTVTLGKVLLSHDAMSETQSVTPLLEAPWPCKVWSSHITHAPRVRSMSDHHGVDTLNPSKIAPFDALHVTPMTRLHHTYSTSTCHTHEPPMYMHVTPASHTHPADAASNDCHLDLTLALQGNRLTRGAVCKVTLCASKTSHWHAGLGQH
jgi:hypothetical protein